MMLGIVASDFCSDLEKILGSDCKTQKPNCLTVSCDFNLLDVERIQVDLDLHGVCVDTAEKSIKFSLIEDDLDIHYSNTIPFSTGSDSFPIPDLSIKIPITGITAGVYGVVNVSGTTGNFNLDAGVDACAVTQGKNTLECGSQLTHALPFWLLRGVLNATDACLAPEPPTPAPTPPPTFENATAACNTCIEHKQSTIGYNHVWCWETQKCYDVGDVIHDHCKPSDCASKAPTTTCEQKVCTAPAN